MQIMESWQSEEYDTVNVGSSFELQLFLTIKLDRLGMSESPMFLFIISGIICLD